MAYGVFSGAVKATSDFMTIRVLIRKCSGPKVVILSGAYCSYYFPLAKHMPILTHQDCK